MTEFSQPWAGILTGDAGAYSDDQWSDMWKGLFAKGRDDFGVLQGIDNELEVTISSTGPPDTIQVDTGEAVVDGKYYTNDAAVTTVLPAVAGTYLAVLTKVWATQTVRVDVREGAALVQIDGTEWEIPLAQITVAADGTASLLIDLRRFINLWSPAPTRNNVENLFRNFPSVQLADDAKPDWWDETGTATVEEVDLAGEGIAGLEDALGHDRGLHLAQGGTGGSSNYISQTFTFADEDQLQADKTKISLIIPVWNVDAGTFTVEVFDNGGAVSLATVTTTAIGQLTILRIEDIEVGTTGIDVRFYHSAINGDAYWSRPMMNVGSYAQAWKPRGITPIDVQASSVVDGVDPGGGGFTDVDLTAVTSPIAMMAEISTQYRNSTTINTVILLRRNGSAEAGRALNVIRGTATAQLTQANSLVVLDDGQIFEYDSDAVAGDAENLTISVVKYWKWK